MSKKYNFHIAECDTIIKTLVMKILLLAGLFFGQQMYGQVSSYQFSQSTQTYQPLVGTATVNYTPWGDPQTYSLDLPFTFYFNRVAYDRLRVNSNGFITFGIYGTTPYHYPISGAISEGIHGVVAGFAWQLASNLQNPQPIVYGIEGSGTNRVFVVEWRNARRVSNTPGVNLGDNVNFQIRLYETTNRVEIRYGTCTTTSSENIYVQVGLRGATNADFNNRGSSNGWYGTISGNYNYESVLTKNTDMPASGLTFSYVPAPCEQVSGVSVIATSATTANLSWIQPATPVLGDYQWELRTSGAGGSGSVGLAYSGTTPPQVVTASVSALAGGASYTLYVRSNCGGNFSNWVSSANTITMPLCPASSVPYTQNFESAIVPAMPGCTSVHTLNGGNSWTTANNPGNGFTTKTLQYTYSNVSANTWFYTNGITLTAGVPYRLTYKYGNSDNTENLKVAMGTSSNATAMTTTLADHFQITGGVPQTNTVDFTPTASGIYYLGFHAYTVREHDNLYVDDITVTTNWPSCPS